MIDSHCHLDHQPLLSNIDDVIKRSKQEGIEKLLTICTTLKSFNQIIKLIKHDQIIFGTFGIHPHETSQDKVLKDEIIKNFNENEKIIGIGETGLDFFYNNSDKLSQIESFKEHIEAAIHLDCPLIVHSRNAEKETYEILNEYKDEKPKILMHCFTGSTTFASKLFELNCFFSASGIITFKNSLELQETFKTIPIDKLLIETDSPYLAPVPNRGKKNEPSFIRFTAKKLAEIKSLHVSQIIENTTNNFNKLFFN
tara:strand:- start:1160 stop:1921 length:762 start_codon:yes stop_codon:yes gene_type:complete